MKVGVVVGYRGRERNLEEKLQNVLNMGFSACQLICWRLPEDLETEAAYVRETCEKFDVNVSSFWCGWPGPARWNFTEGPITLGLVPPEYRFERLKYLTRGIEFAHLAGIRQVATHAGFIPEDMNDPKYMGTVVALRALLGPLKRYEMKFLFETGQETPTTLLRLITDLDPAYFGVNFDSGNLILYGKANPADAIDILAPYVCDLHAKDGLYPTDGMNLGHEVPLGQGKANIGYIIKKLLSVGYQGPVTIEREISGDQQTKDILMAKELLEKYIAEAQ